VSSKWGKDNLVKLLLEKGGQIDAKTKDGLSKSRRLIDDRLRFVILK